MDENAKVYAKILRERLKTYLVKIYLFGSRARGDFKENSDYDFIIVATDDNNFIKDIIIQTEVDFLNNFDKLASSILYREEEWEKVKKYPLGYNVLREGVEL